MADIKVLNREMFSEAEAARLLTVSQSTLHYWSRGWSRSLTRDHSSTASPEQR